MRWRSAGLAVEPSADIIVGLGWGDEGKGATVDALAAAHPTQRVVRFNGGQQAAHNVMVSDRHHTFSNFGSATLSGVETWWSHYCTLDPFAIAVEKRALQALGINPLLMVDGEALVTTSLHVLANLRREAARGSERHGTTGTGFGETIGYSLDHPAIAIRAKHLFSADSITDRLHHLRDTYVTQGLVGAGEPGVGDRALADLVDHLRSAARAGFDVVTTDDLLDELRTGHTIFEGAQGFVLDENFGFNPHTTWSTTTPSNARALLRTAGVERVRAIGCLRTYATRHGAGPLPGEGLLPFNPPEPHNSDDSAAGSFRTALHEPPILRWAINVTGVDALAVSHLDVFPCLQTTEGDLEIDALGLPVAVEAYGPKREDRILF